MIDSITTEETVKNTETTGSKTVEGCSAKIILVLFHKGKPSDPVVKAEELCSASLEGSNLIS